MKINCTKNLNTFFEYCIALSLILHLRTTWSFITGIRDYFTLVNILLLIVGCLGCIAINRVAIKRVDFRKWVLYLLIATVYLSFHYTIKPYDISATARFIIAIVSIVSAMYFSNKQDLGVRILIKFKELILLIAIVSLLFWSLGSIAKVINPTQQVYSEWNDRYVNSYFYLYFEPQTAFSIFSGNSLTRNCAIFAEAPMCSFAFTIALFIEQYIVLKKSKKKMAILILGILSTVSSMGYIMLVMSFYVYFLTYKEKGRLILFLKIVLLVAGIGVAGYVLSLLEGKLSSVSGSIRLDDFRAGFISWKEDVLFGNGLNNLEAIQRNMSSFRSNNIGFSNSIMQILSDGGLLLGTLYFIPVIVGFKNMIRSKDYDAALFASLFLIEFIVTIVSYTNLAVFLIVLLLTNKMHTERYYSI